MDEFDPTSIKPDQTIALIYKLNSYTNFTNTNELKAQFIEKVLTANILNEETN